MSIRTFLIATLVALSVSPAAAQDPTGRWNAVVSGKNGPLPVAFTFEQKADKLVGFFSNDWVAPVAIEQGTIVDGELRFTLTLQMSQAPVKLAYLGTIDGGTLTLKATRLEGGDPSAPAETTIVATRAP